MVASAAAIFEEFPRRDLVAGELAETVTKTW